MLWFSLTNGRGHLNFDRLLKKKARENTHYLYTSKRAHKSTSLAARPWIDREYVVLKHSADAPSSTAKAMAREAWCICICGSQLYLSIWRLSKKPNSVIQGLSMLHSKHHPPSSLWHFGIWPMHCFQTSVQVSFQKRELTEYRFDLQIRSIAYSTWCAIH